jgi:P-type E1-E2 ATPase
MIEIEIPGRGMLRLQHLVTDVNGTLAVDGMLIEGVAEKIHALKQHLTIHLLTADTHGRQTAIDHLLGLTAIRIQPGNEAEQKTAYVRRLGAERVAALGQGANDAGMLKTAALGLCILSPEGTAVETLLAADLLLTDIHAALALFEHPLRIRASLRK